MPIDDRYTELRQPGLKYGIVEVTTSCQLRCPGCYMVRRQSLTGAEMTLAEAVRVLDMCRDYTGQELETMDILGGEPLLWAHLQQYIDILMDRGILPWVFTNMLAINESLANWLFERQVHITGKLNIDPTDPKQIATQAAMLGSNTEIAVNLLGGISVFKAAGYRDPLFRVQNLIRKSNIGLVPGYYRWCLENEVGTDLEMMGSGETIGPDYWAIAPTPVQIAQMIREIQVVRQDFGLPPAEVLMPHVFGSCPFYDKGLYFACDGSIRSCTNSTVNLANINDHNPISKAYKSELICNRCRLNQELVGEPCHSCDRFEKCRGGCRATVEGLGDPFGGYPLCPVPYL